MWRGGWQGTNPGEQRHRSGKPSGNLACARKDLDGIAFGQCFNGRVSPKHAGEIDARSFQGKLSDNVTSRSTMIS